MHARHLTLSTNNCVHPGAAPDAIRQNLKAVHAVVRAVPAIQYEDLRKEMSLFFKEVKRYRDMRNTTAHAVVLRVEGSKPVQATRCVHQPQPIDDAMGSELEGAATEIRRLAGEAQFVSA